MPKQAVHFDKNSKSVNPRPSIFEVTQKSWVKVWTYKDLSVVLRKYFLLGRFLMEMKEQFRLVFLDIQPIYNRPSKKYAFCQKYIFAFFESEL